MNISIREKLCDDTYFNAIKYYAHNLETYDMKVLIEEIISVNPVLAADIILTSEFDFEFMNLMVDKLIDEANTFVRLERRVMLTISLEMLGSNSYISYLDTFLCTKKKKEMSKKMGFDDGGKRKEREWRMLPQYLISLLVDLLIRNNMYDRYYLLQNKIPDSAFVFISDSDKMIQQMLETGNYTEFLQLVESEGVYGKLSEYGFDVETMIDDIFEHLPIVPKKYIGLSEAVQKIVAIFLYKTNDIEHILKQIKEKSIPQGYKLKKVITGYRVFRNEAKFYILEEKDFEHWDVIKNGIDEPVIYYCNNSFWLIRECGHSVKAINGKANPVCKQCNATSMFGRIATDKYIHYLYSKKNKWDDEYGV